MGDHRVIVGIGILRDVEILLHDAILIVQERPMGPHPEAQIIDEDEVIGRDGDEPGEPDRDLVLKGGELAQLLPVLRTIDAAPEHQDHRVIALEHREPARGVGVIGEARSREKRRLGRYPHACLLLGLCSGYRVEECEGRFSRLHSIPTL